MKRNLRVKQSETYTVNEAWYIYDVNSFEILRKDGTFNFTSGYYAFKHKNLWDCPGFWKTKAEAKAFLMGWEKSQVSLREPEPMCREGSCSSLHKAQMSLRESESMCIEDPCPSLRKAILECVDQDQFRLKWYSEGYEDGYRGGFKDGENSLTRKTKEAYDKGYRLGSCRSAELMNREVNEARKKAENGYNRGKEEGFKKGKEEGFKEGVDSMRIKWDKWRDVKVGQYVVISPYSGFSPLYKPILIQKISDDIGSAAESRLYCCPGTGYKNFLSPDTDCLVLGDESEHGI